MLRFVIVCCVAGRLGGGASESIYLMYRLSLSKQSQVEAGPDNTASLSGVWAERTSRYGYKKISDS